jgi:hypothetical protein
MRKQGSLVVAVVAACAALFASCTPAPVTPTTTTTSTTTTSTTTTTTTLPAAVLNWSQRTTPVAPSARNGVGMVYFAAIGKTVLVGGNNGTGARLAETWLWDGSTWEKLAAPSPGGAFVGLAYDSFRERVVRYSGGSTVSEFDGTSWTTITPPKRPSNRQVVTMAYDAVRKRVVMFGGLNFTPSPLNDTWEWDGTNWTEVAISSLGRPPARAYHAMTYDAARQKVVMFGGDSLHGGSGVIYNDTWEWDGTSWSQASPAVSPPPNDGHNMVFDTTRNRTVMLGSSQTWEWDGTNWTQNFTAATPPARAWFGMAYDSARSSTVAFGGYGYSLGYLNDTWEYKAN